MRPLSTWWVSGIIAWGLWSDAAAPRLIAAPPPATVSSGSASQTGELHIHVDNPQFVPTKILIPTRNLITVPTPAHPRDPLGARIKGDHQLAPQELAWTGKTLAHFSAQLDKLLTATQFFTVSQRGIGAADEKSWPQLDSQAPATWAQGLRQWLAKPEAKSAWQTTDLILFTQLSVMSASAELRVYLVDFRVQQVVYQRSFRWPHRQRQALSEFMYELADDILKLVSGGEGLYSSRIVFIGRKTPKDVKQVYTCRLDGSDLKQITTDPVIHLSPTWSADGEQLIFTSYRSGNPDLYRYHMSTQVTHILSSHPGLDSGGAADPLSTWVTFSSRGGRDADLYVVSLQGGTRRLLVRGVGLDVDPTFSRDGRYLAYVSGRFGRPHIFRAELNRTQFGGLQVVKDKRLTWAGWYNGNPAFSRDSRKIAFAGYDKEIDRFDIFMMNADGQNLERLTLNTGDNESPSWAPNDQLIVFESSRSHKSTTKGPKQLYVMRRDGRFQTQLPLNLYSAESPDWGPAQLKSAE